MSGIPGRFSEGEWTDFQVCEASPQEQPGTEGKWLNLPGGCPCLSWEDKQTREGKGLCHLLGRLGRYVCVQPPTVG